MKKTLLVVLFLTFAATFAQAQITNLTVNGVSSNFSVVSGDSVWWNFDLPTGGTAYGEFWIDFNDNQQIDSASDRLLFSFYVTDGQANNGQGSPWDMDDSVNGHIIWGTRMGLAPAHYIFRLSNNGSSESIAGVVTPIINPPYTISGIVSPPNGVGRANIDISASAGGEKSVNNSGNVDPNQYLALTQSDGSYMIALDSNAAASPWDIKIMDQFSTYSSVPTDSVVSLSVNPNPGGINFTFLAASSIFQGVLTGEDGKRIASAKVQAQLMNNNNGNSYQSTTNDSGFFEMGLPASAIVAGSPWRIWVSEDNIVPRYFPPEKDSLYISAAETVAVNLVAFLATDSITGYLTIDGHAPNGFAMQLFLNASDSGSTSANSDPTTGAFTFYVTPHIYNYFVSASSSSLPAGYELLNQGAVHPGATGVVVNLIKPAWQLQTNLGTTNDLKSVLFVTPNTGWISGANGTLLKTTDGGVSWNPENPNSGGIIHSLSFSDSLNGWFADDSGRVGRTTNGGSTWSFVNYGIVINVEKVEFLNRDTGWVLPMCPNNVFARTTNGGASWMAETLRIGCTNVMRFVNLDTGWAGGTFNSIFLMRTTDGGMTWSPQDTMGNNTITSLFFLNSQTGWAAGYSSQVSYTTDGGATWGQAMNSFNDIHVIKFVSATTGWIGADIGQIGYTTDGGHSWTLQAVQQNGPVGSIRSMSFSDASNGWAVGDNGLFLHTTTGGIPTGVKEPKSALSAIPKKYALYQNYPNPFNPTTTISFSLPQASHVTLKIYNLIGQEVQKLIDEERPPGNYTVVWNPRNLASGVYFYRLQTGTTILTKKLVLMR
jgi:photosystem II stability/assembly factor-like uncharacterized protein